MGVQAPQRSGVEVHGGRSYVFLHDARRLVENGADIRHRVFPRSGARTRLRFRALLNALLDDRSQLVVQGAERSSEQDGDAFTGTPQLNCVKPRRRIEDGLVDGVTQSAVFEIRAVEQDRHELGVVTPDVIEILERRRVLRRDIVRPRSDRDLEALPEAAHHATPQRQIGG